MKITIDSNILEQHNITLEEFLVLYLGAKNADIKSISQEVIRKGLLETFSLIIDILLSVIK